jgi:hypothetical protein
MLLAHARLGAARAAGGSNNETAPRGRTRRPGISKRRPRWRHSWLPNAPSKNRGSRRALAHMEALRGCIGLLHRRRRAGTNSRDKRLPLGGMVIDERGFHTGTETSCRKLPNDLRQFATTRLRKCGCERQQRWAPRCEGERRRALGLVMAGATPDKEREKLKDVGRCYRTRAHGARLA